MPAGTPVEATAAALADLGAAVATLAEVVDYQAYAGTAAPINFNGLVRQYDLRQLPEQGELQVNLVDRTHRSRQSHEIALACARRSRRSRRGIGAKVKIVEVPPGPPVLSPIVAEIYGPDEAGRHCRRQVVAGRVRGDAGRRRHRRSRSKTTRRARWCASTSARRRWWA